MLSGHDRAVADGVDQFGLESLQGKIIALTFSMAAESERGLISQRTRAALRFKKAQGLKLVPLREPGKGKLDAFRPVIESLLANSSTRKFIARRYRTRPIYTIGSKSMA